MASSSMSPLEMEKLRPAADDDDDKERPSSRRPHGGRLPVTRWNPPNAPSPSWTWAVTSWWAQFCLLIRLYLQANPTVAATVVALTVLITFYVTMETVVLWNPRARLTRNPLVHSYANLTSRYDFKQADLDHWCLYGDDNKYCSCDDCVDPASRFEVPGWNATHQANVRRAQQNAYSKVTFLGDDMVERWNGREVQKLFNDTFNNEEDADFRAVALGIAGDSAPNLLYRVQQKELPDYSMVYWLWIGTNDLADRLCSEEATALGILRVAEEVAFLQPESIVVIQALLPRSNLGGDSWQVTPPKHHRNRFWGGDRATPYHSVDEAMRASPLWPAIQDINGELLNFCEDPHHQEQFRCFDPSSYFLTEDKEMLKKELFADDHVHLNYAGYQLLAQLVQKKVIDLLSEMDDYGTDDGT